MASNQPPGIKITGIRGSIPSGYLLGRSAPGSGDVQLMTLKAMQSAGLAPVTLPPSGAAGGDLSGTYPNPTVAKLQGSPISLTAPDALDVLAWSGTAWAPLDLATVAYTGVYADLTGKPPLTGGSAGQVLTKIDGTDYNFHWAAGGGSSGGAASIYDTGTNIYMALVDGDGQMVLDGSGLGIYSLEVFPVASIPALPYASSALTSAHILVGSAGNVATDVAVTGDVTITNAGVTAIKNDVALGGNPTTTTQSVGNNTTRLATTGFVAAALPVGANPSATGSDAAVNGSAATFMRSDAAPAIQKCSSSVFGLAKVDNTTITAAAGVITAVLPTGANPSATGSDTAVNGSAATFMRSDGAPAIQKCSSSAFGLAKVDNSTITAATGVIATAATGGYVSGAITNITVNKVKGVTDGSNAAAGDVGEVIEATVTFGSPTTGFVSTVAKDVMSLTLTPGDWMVEAQLQTIPAATTTTGPGVYGGIHTVSNTLPAIELRYQNDGLTSAANNSVAFSLSRRRFNVTVNTTIYIVGRVTFAVSTMSMCGFANAVRIR